MSQKIKVKNRILEVGYVDNFWAIENHILRLGAVVFSLRAEGMNFTGMFGKEIGKERAYWKNYYYTRKEPASVSTSEAVAVFCPTHRYEDCSMCSAQEKGVFVPPHTHESVNNQTKLL